MKYNHTKVESAEYLRLALPHMSKHDAPLNPISLSFPLFFVFQPIGIMPRIVACAEC
jgi:hypothetical protein